MELDDSDTRQIKLAACLCSALALILYLPSILNELVLYDDHKYIYQNQSLEQPFLEYLIWSFGFHFYNWHPLTWIVFKVEHMAWGLNPSGYHIVSIILHLINSALVTFLSYRLFMYSSHIAKDKVVLAATIAGAIFAIHPLHVESVSWASETKGMLYSVFWLLGIVYYMAYAGSGYKNSRKYLSCIFMFALSLLSKPMAVTFPVVLLIIDFYPLGRFSLKPSRELFKAIIEKLPLFAMSAALSVLTVLAQNHGNNVATLQLLPFSDRVLNVFWALGFYTLKSFVPTGLVPFYHHRTATFPLTYDYWIAILFVMAITFGSILAYKRNNRWPLAVSAYIFITLLPTLGLVQVGAQIAADRYMYLPILGILLPLSASIALISNKINKNMLMTTGIIIAVGLSILTLRQQSIWKNSDALWDYIVKMEPDSTRGRLGRFSLNQGRGDFNKVIEDLTWVINYHNINREKLSYHPFEKYYAERADAYSEIGEHEKAAEDLGSAIFRDPSNPDYYFKRAVAYKRLGLIDKASADYNKTIYLSPEHVSAHNNLATVYMLQEKAGMALGSITKAIALDPENGKYYMNRAKIYGVMGDRERSEADIKKAYALGYTPANIK